MSVIDPTVTIGNMIEIGTIIVGGVIVFAAVRASVGNLEANVTEMKVDIRSLNKSFTELAVVNNRIKNVEEDIRELRHGRGFVRNAIEGEWPRPQVPPR